MSRQAGDGGLRRLDIGLAAAALIALAALVIEHGFLPQPGAVRFLHGLQVACAFAFGALQAAKLLVVDQPGAYLRAHRLDFSFLFVLAVQGGVHLALRQTPELAYFARRGLPSPLSPFYVGVLQAYLLVIVALRSHFLHRILARMKLQPVQMLVASFGLLIVIGTALLALPGAASEGRSIGVVDALFTATSAVCVTGLVVKDTGVDFSPMGQSVIFALLQAGGLGILTLTASFALVSGRRLRRDEQRALARALDIEEVAGMRATIARILLTTFAIEAAGTVMLWLLWSDRIADPFLRWLWAAFHAVSAFCNAGFALFSGNASLTAFVDAPGTCVVIAALIVLGGLGFPVLVELFARAAAVARGRPVATLGRHARWVVASAAGLIVLGSIGFWMTTRAGVLAGRPASETLLAAVFQSVTLRTAGFNTVPLGSLGVGAVAVCVAFMLVGGAPAGTAGGLKTTTAIAAVGSWMRRPRLDRATSRRAARLAALFLFAYAISCSLLALAQGSLDRRVAFEAASALGTVGLTMDYTDELTTAAKLIVCATMFAGRVGPFAFAASLLFLRDSEEVPRGPEAILIG